MKSKFVQSKAAFLPSTAAGVELRPPQVLVRTARPRNRRPRGVPGSAPILRRHQRSQQPTSRRHGTVPQAEEAGGEGCRDLPPALADWLDFLFLFLQTNRSGCATFAVLMSPFTKLDNKVLNDRLRITADVAEEGTGEASGRKGRSGRFSSGKRNSCSSPRSEARAAAGSRHLLHGRNAVLPGHARSL